MNFGDFDLYGLQNFGKVFVTSVRPCWDKWWKILILPIWWYRQVMINHRGGILIFCQILNFGRNRKFEILNPSSNPNSGSLTLKPKFGFCQICHDLVNLICQIWIDLNLSFPKTPNRQIWTNFGPQNPKFLILSQILWVLGGARKFLSRGIRENRESGNFPKKVLQEAIETHSNKIAESLDKNSNNFRDLPSDLKVIGEVLRILFDKFWIFAPNVVKFLKFGKISISAGQIAEIITIFVQTFRDFVGVRLDGLLQHFFWEISAFSVFANSSW